MKSVIIYDNKGVKLIHIKRTKEGIDVQSQQVLDIEVVSYLHNKSRIKVDLRK